MRNPVFDIDNWREIGATLSQNKTRTFLTAFGIFWGTAILALLLGASEGFNGFMRSQFDGLATNLAIVFPGRTTKPYGGYQKGMEVSLNDRDIAMIRSAVPEINALSTINQFGASALHADKTTSGSLLGAESDYFDIFTPKVYEGRLLNETDDARMRKVCVLGKRLASELFGTGSAVNQEIQVNGIYYKVVGVAGQTSEVSLITKIDDAIFIPASLMRRSYNLGDKVAMFLFTVTPGHTPSDYEGVIRRIISSNHPVAPDDEGAVYFMDISKQFKMIDNIFLGISLLATLVGFGTLLSGIIGVGNIMWIIEGERTQEIGIRRSIGAKPRDIIIQILSEGVVLTLIAGLAGICFAVLILGVAQSIFASNGTILHFQLSFAQAVGIMIVFVVLGSLAGLVPALKAMKIKPVEALNSK